MPLDPPPLVLSDIVHDMSPSPEPQDSTAGSDMHCPTPGQLAEERTTSMIQLLHQAEIIASLTEQRNFLIREAELQRERWNSEREGWDRQAEALIAQRALGSANQWNAWSGYVKDAAAQQREREYHGLVADNRSLRAKLQDAQHRFVALESQLADLRPLLLTQPTITNCAFGPAATSHEPSQPTNLLSTSHSSPLVTPIPPSTNPQNPESSLISILTQSAQSTPLIWTGDQPRFEFPQETFPLVLGESVQPAGKDARFRVGVMRYVDEAEDKPITSTIQGLSAPVLVAVEPEPQILPPQEQEKEPGEFRRRFGYTGHLLPSPTKSKSAHANEKGKEKRRLGSGRRGWGRTAMMDDARTEHLLLAARRLGRQRAFIVGGLIRVEKETGKIEKENVEKQNEKMVKEKDTQMQLEETEGEATNEKEQKKESIQSKKKHGEKVKTGRWHKNEGGTGDSREPLPPGGSFSTFRLSPPRKVQPKPIPVTPMQTRTSPHTHTPHTPLDSLLSAARSLMDPDLSPVSSSKSDSGSAADGAEQEQEEADLGEGPSTRMTTRRMTIARTPRKRSMPESPIPAKRRKATTGKAPSAAAATKFNTEKAVRERAQGAERVRSALDVLADQAANAFTFSSKDAKAKGKGKERERSIDEDKRSMQEGQFVFHARPQPARAPMAEHGSWSRLRAVQWGDRNIQEDGGGEGGTLDSDADPQAAIDVFIDRIPTLQGTAPGEPVLPLHRFKPTQSSPSNLTLQSLEPEKAVPTLSTMPIVAYPPPMDEQGGPTHANVHQRAVTIPTSLNNTLTADITMEDSAGNTHTRERTEPGILIEGLTTMSDLDITEDLEIEQVINRDLEAGTSAASSSKRTRSPYVKWSQAEDDKLAQAVATYGQKWDLVQKELPKRGYHQVRQRWLRKLGVFDNTPDLSAYQTGLFNFPVGANILQQPSTGGAGELPQPKLGLAPLSSDLSFSRK